MKKLILFQGDSITDCGRDRDNPICLGMGYPSRVAGTLGADRPGDEADSHGSVCPRCVYGSSELLHARGAGRHRHDHLWQMMTKEQGKRT